MSTLQALPLLPREERLLLSVAQFRPEKDHALQLQASRHAHTALSRRAALSQPRACARARARARARA